MFASLFAHVLAATAFAGPPHATLREAVRPRVLAREPNQVRRSDLPEVVSIGTRDGGECSGTLVSDRAVITAAHCIDWSSNVIDGFANRIQFIDGVRRPVRCFRHPGYLETTVARDGRDVALCVLAAPVRRPTACIGPPPRVDDRVALVGFGLSNGHGMEETDDDRQQRLGYTRIARVADGLVETERLGAMSGRGDSGGFLGHRRPDETPSLRLCCTIQSSDTLRRNGEVNLDGRTVAVDLSAPTVAEFLVATARRENVTLCGRPIPALDPALRHAPFLLGARDRFAESDGRVTVRDCDRAHPACATLRNGDEITYIDNLRVRSRDDLRDAIATVGNRPYYVVAHRPRRNGGEEVVSVLIHPR